MPREIKQRGCWCCSMRAALGQAHFQHDAPHKEKKPALHWTHIDDVRPEKMWTKRPSNAQKSWDTAAMAHASPQGTGWMGSRSVWSKAKRGHPHFQGPPGFTWNQLSLHSPREGSVAIKYSSGAGQPLTTNSANTQQWALNHLGYLHGYGFCHPPGKSAQDHLMKTSYNRPPEIFWLATVFQADKRGICESPPWLNKVLFNSVKMLNLL